MASKKGLNFKILAAFLVTLAACSSTSRDSKGGETDPKIEGTICMFSICVFTQDEA